MPKISVIMSVYSETLEQLKRSVSSILGQSVTDFEFIIVLDNPENSKAEEYIQEQAKKDSRIVFLKNETNLKLGASLNKGIEKAIGKYIARMDGDDSCDTTKLEKQYKYLESHEEVMLLFTGWEERDEKGNIEVRIPTKKDFQNIQKTFFYKAPLLHASMMCRAKIFETHMYPEIDRPEDFSLFLALIDQGYFFDILEENLYTFYVDRYDIEKKYQKIHVFSANFLQILWKNIPLYSMNPYFWWMMFVCSIQWGLSRNKRVFVGVFDRLQRLYKKLFI